MVRQLVVGQVGHDPREVDEARRTDLAGRVRDVVGGPAIALPEVVVVEAVLKPSTTITRPSGSVACPCPARVPSMGGPTANVPVLIVKMCVPVVDAPVESAPSDISSWSELICEIAP